VIAKNDLFNRIAPYYGWFYTMQRKNYSKILREHLHLLNLPEGAAILDIGCGTGAFCSALHDFGFTVTGIDPAERMLEIARKHNGGKDIRFIQGSVLAGLPFADQQFDCVLTAYVAHGFKYLQRMILYQEMQRLSRKLVLVHDFHGPSSLLIQIIERLEGSDYENFRVQAAKEMKEVFGDMRVVQVNERAAWYLGDKK
jgi:ubiquinone/menaquinone biosynthesis C-methylase UbiE